MSTDLREQSSASGCLLRLFWFFFGNMLLGYTGFQLLFRKSAQLSLLDFSFWLLVVAILAARFIDVSYCQGTTTDGKPATQKDWQSHAISLVAIAAIAWLATFAKAYFLHG